MKRKLPLTLPCVPCAYDSVCCSHGTDVTAREAEAIAARWGADRLVVRDGETRTKVVDGKCNFFVGGAGCAIHAEPYYPVVCRLFPWRDSEAPQEPYRHDLDICPELTNDMNRSLAERLPTSPRLSFRWWRADDLALATALWGDPRVTALIDARPALSAVDVEARLQSERASAARDGVQYWPLFVDGATFVGCAGLAVRTAEPRVYQLGFHLLPSAWGSGLATEAARAAASFAFDELGADALFAGHHPANVASRRVLEKLGFRHTHDELYPPTGLVHPGYGLTAAEWRQRAQAPREIC